MKKFNISFFFLLLYVLAVLYITVISRSRTMLSIVHFDVLWSYRKWMALGWRYGKQILLNIGMFIPLGWLVSSILPKSPKHAVVMKALFLCILFSVLIEAIQFACWRGSLDVDDVINNGLGGLIGSVAYVLLGERPPRAPVSWILVFAGIVGCFMFQTKKTENEEQFLFSINSVENADGLIFSGDCISNGTRTPKYSLLLRRVTDGTEYVTDVITEGEKYTSTADVEKGKYEVLVHFRHFPVLSTGTYINGDQVAFVAEEVTEPRNASGILKAYNSEYDTFVYQDGGNLVWYIGYDIEPTTEIIYHIHTNEKELLPEERIQYGFDNRGFRRGESDVRTEDGYLKYEKQIPTEYPITAVTVGFNPGGGVTWWKSIRVIPSPAA